jgi:DNA-binding NtrC family response regulator
MMKRILVVDDESSIRRALAMGLTSKDFEVDVAEDGMSGIRLGSWKQYEVLIVDLCLPDIDGLEVIRKIKAYSSEAISIVITGNPSSETSIEAICEEVNAYLEKPLDMQSVKNAIHRGLEQREQKRKATKKE